MKKRIFTGTFFTCISIILACIILISGFLYRYYSNQVVSALRTNLNYIEHMVEEHGTEHLAKLDTPQSICLTDSEGNILLSTKNSATNAELVKEAKDEGTGTSSEHLSISKKQVGVSTLLSDGSVLCVFSSQHTFVSLLLSMYVYVLIILGVAVLLSLLLARKLSTKILKPVYELDLTAPDKSKVYPELSPFIDRINEQNNELQRQIRENEAKHEQQPMFLTS